MRLASPNMKPMVRWLLRSRAGHYLRLALVALPVLWLAHHAIFGTNGYRALRQRQQAYAQTTAHVHQLEARNRELNQAVKALRSNPESIETIAREQLHLTRPGEVVYTYPVQKPGAPANSDRAASLRTPR